MNDTNYISLADRVNLPVSLLPFSCVCNFDSLGVFDIESSPKDQYILRMCVKHRNGDLKVPQELKWIYPILRAALAHQHNLGVKHPFIYITVRNGCVKSLTDDEWHLDGFSTRVKHKPEQNYIITDCYPTQYVSQNYSIDNNLNPLKHNVNFYLEKQVKKESIKTLNPNELYCIDPFILHKRPYVPDQINRKFLRISFTPIEIDDINNTQNPLMYITYKKNGVDFRNSLKAFEHPMVNKLHAVENKQRHW